MTPCAPLLVGAIALSAGGCRRIEPVARSAPPDPMWLPAARYGADRFHPANRWFHRVVAAREGGRISRSDTAADPDGVPRVATGLDAVDGAEIAALVDAAAQEIDALDADGRRRFARDLASVAQELDASALELAAAHRALAAALEALSAEDDPRAEPPTDPAPAPDPAPRSTQSAAADPD